MEYGGLRFRFDFQVQHDGAEADGADMAMKVGSDGVLKREGQPRGGQCAHGDAARPHATSMAVEQPPAPPPAASQPAAQGCKLPGSKALCLAAAGQQARW